MQEDPGYKSYPGGATTPEKPPPISILTFSFPENVLFMQHGLEFAQCFIIFEVFQSCQPHKHKDRTLFHTHISILCLLHCNYVSLLSSHIGSKQLKAEIKFYFSILRSFTQNPSQ